MKSSYSSTKVYLKKVAIMILEKDRKKFPSKVFDELPPGIVVSPLQRSVSQTWNLLYSSWSWKKPYGTKSSWIMRVWIYLWYIYLKNTCLWVTTPNEFALVILIWRIRLNKISSWGYANLRIIVVSPELFIFGKLKKLCVEFRFTYY